MQAPTISTTFLWDSCGEPGAAWFLVWMPIILLALEREASLSSAMVRLLAVLLVAALIWARGLGADGPVGERLFVAGWAASWAAALGILVTTNHWPASVLGSAGLLATLFVGAGWLGWAYHQRQELHARRDRQNGDDEKVTPPASTTTIVMTWLLTTLIFGLMMSSRNAHWGDGFALAASLVCFTAFQRGHVTLPHLHRPEPAS